MARKTTKVAPDVMEHTLTLHTKHSQWVAPANKPDATIGEFVPGNGPALYRYSCSCGWQQATWRTDQVRGLKLAHELHPQSNPEA